jgi:gliding motility-associated-like protein
MCCRLLVFLTSSLLIFINSFGQEDAVGSGGAIRFDGVDDYIDYGDRYSDLELPFTVSAWVYLDPSNSIIAPIFSNRNCDPIYTGFRLMVDHNVISLDYGDGFGGNNPAFRAGKNAILVSPITGNWNHITAVVKGPLDMDLYLNGVNVGGDYSGDSPFAMDSSKPGFSSTAYFISNGRVYRFKGVIDDIRLWDRALSETEIRTTMCVNLTGSEAGLVGYWNFNETSGSTVFDRSANEFHGDFISNPSRVRSGAPIGDISTNLYSPILDTKTLSLTNGSSKLTVHEVSNSSLGVQIYSVNQAPSETSGLESVSPPYFGVFTALQNSSSTFSIQNEVEDGSICQVFSRYDNSSTPWSSIDQPIINQQKRREFILSSGLDATALDLGPDVAICNEDHYTISTGITDPELNFTWSTLETTSSIIVAESGEYTVTVTGSCVELKDTLAVRFFSAAPEPFTFGDDRAECSLAPTTLRIPDCPGCIITWQDGSTESEYQVTDFGEYWVVVENACGKASDSVTFSKYKFEVFPPNVITPNEDLKNDTFIVNSEIEGPVQLFVFNRWGREVFYSESYDNTWNGNGLSEGTYFIIVDGPCIARQKSFLQIVR